MLDYRWCLVNHRGVPTRYARSVPLSFSRGGTSGITISSLHAGWILIEAQRIKLLKIRLSLCSSCFLFLSCTWRVRPTTSPTPLTSSLAFRVGRRCCEPFFRIRIFCLTRIVIIIVLKLIFIIHIQPGTNNRCTSKENTSEIEETFFFEIMFAN